MTLRVRELRDADAQAIWSMLEPVFRAGDTYAIDRDVSREDALAYWTAHHAYVAEGDAPVGTYYIRPNHTGGGAHVCNCGYITAQAAQGRGVARAMLAHSLETARALGFEAMQFNLVLTSNPRAVRTWDKAGFATIGRLPRVFKLPDGQYTDALIMHKFL